VLVRSVRRRVLAVLFSAIGAAAAAAAPGPAVICGDGIPQAPEECDDGNSVGGDGCDQLCRLPWAFVIAGQSNAEGRSTLNGDVVGFPGVTSPDPVNGRISRTFRSRYLFDTEMGFPTWVAANDWPCANLQCSDAGGSCALRTKATHTTLDPNCECHCGNSTDVDAGVETLSAWPTFARRMMRDASREVELISVNLGSTSLVHDGGVHPGAPLWDSNVDCSGRDWTSADAWSDERGDLYCLMLHAVEAAGVGARLKAVLWYQGETDAAAAVPQHEYKAALMRFVDDVKADLDVPTIAAPISLCLFTGDPCHTANPAIRAIHDATQQAIAEHPFLLAGPETDDLEHLDRVHVQDVVTLGARWAAATRYALQQPVPACANQIDDDGDGLVDHPDDPGCAGAASLTENPACNDGIDNDTDARIDHPADPGCASAASDQETTVCDDGIDNDGDGHVDHPIDPACPTALASTESSRCQDGIDNDDGDGLIDFDGGASHNGGTPLTAPDPECVGKPHKNRETRSCGLGAELALLFGTLGARASRMRGRN
jgi:cysteine-rich repeat protein